MSTTTFTALAEPSRRHILELLFERPRLVGELVQRLGLSQPGVSKHLRVLREAGLVDVQRDAQRRLYRLRPEPLAEVDAWLEPWRLQSAGGSTHSSDTSTKRSGNDTQQSGRRPRSA